MIRCCLPRYKKPFRTYSGTYPSRVSSYSRAFLLGSVAFDKRSGLWVATDGSSRGLAKHFLSCPMGADVCELEFSPDGKTLVVSIQHPGSSNEASFDKSSSCWPYFDEGVPKVPSVVAVYRTTEKM